MFQGGYATEFQSSATKWLLPEQAIGSRWLQIILSKRTKLGERDRHGEERSHCSPWSICRALVYEAASEAAAAATAASFDGFSGMIA